MQAKRIGELENDSAKLLTFIKLPFVIKSFVLSICEWLFYKDFTVSLRKDFFNLFLPHFPKEIYQF